MLWKIGPLLKVSIQIGGHPQLTTLISSILLSSNIQFFHLFWAKQQKSALDLFKTDMLSRHIFTKYEHSSTTSETKLILL